MDDVPVEDIKSFELAMIESLRALPSVALQAIKDSGALTDETAATLTDEIAAFKRNYWAKTPAEAVAP
jgi:F0F1-type ATP synthase alpha subunit